MNELVMTGFPYKIDAASLAKRLHCGEEDELCERAIELADAARAELCPAFAIKEFSIDSIDKDGITAGGKKFHSRIAARKLKDAKSVYIYIVTCGRRINALIENTEDELDKYILDQISYVAYLEALDKMSFEIERRFGIERHVRLCPGSVIDWSVYDVCLFFDLLDGLYQQIDVSVLSSGLIDPLKSTSGMLYAAEEEFESCAICPRANCENRKAPFDEELHGEMANL